jgi:hypothetical protein
MADKKLTSGFTVQNPISYTRFFASKEAYVPKSERNFSQKEGGSLQQNQIKKVDAKLER